MSCRNLLVRSTISLALAGAFAVTLTLGASAQNNPFPTKSLTPSQMVSPDILVARINQNCGVFRTAVQSQKPTDVAQVHTSLWRVVSEGDVTAAERTHSFTRYAKVWKQAGNYVWVNSVMTGNQGGRHATQLCFRSNGTLARARQATTIPALDAASASNAYYNTDGSIIRKSAVFSVDDPQIATRIKELPFYKNLP